MSHVCELLAQFRDLKIQVPDSAVAGVDRLFKSMLLLVSEDVRRRHRQMTLMRQVILQQRSKGIHIQGNVSQRIQ